MTDREKLIELLSAPCRKHTRCSENYCKRNREHCQSDFADHLLANGVTFAKDTDVPSKWISVEDKLPKESKYNFEECLVIVTRSHWPTSSYDPVDAPYDEEYTTAACYDHNQKVWHLSRSEVVLNALLKPEDAPLNGEVVTHWMPLPEPPKEDKG